MNPSPRVCWDSEIGLLSRFRPVYNRQHRRSGNELGIHS